MSKDPVNRFYTDIARICSTLLAAVLAMMVFMLIIGIQNPDPNIKTLLFTALISLGASIVLSVLGNILCEWTFSSASRPVGTKKLKATEVKLINDKRSRRLGIFRLVQQAVFIFSIISVVLLALALVQFIYKPTPSPQQSGPASQQQSPPPSAENPEQTAPLTQ